MSGETGAPLNVLLLCDRQDEIAATVHQHIRALVDRSRHTVVPVAMLGDLPAGLALDRFDVIAVHYTLAAAWDGHLSRQARADIGAARAVKALFIQDEHRNVDRTIAILKTLGLDVLFTCVPAPEIEKVYPEATLPGVAKVNVLTGYVDEALTRRAAPPLGARAIDVGYRARKLSPWLGQLGQEKWRIGVRFADDAARYGLICDTAHREEERLYGEAWLDFVTGCKAVLGTESGASVFDMTGALEAAVEADVLREPDVDFETLRARHFKHLDGIIHNNQISPRCFEAAALRTLMILYEGDYSGRLQPWRHYVPLAKDHSNMDDVVAVLRDDARAQAIVDRAYHEVALAPENSFDALAAVFDRAIEDAAARRGNVATPPLDAAARAAIRKLGSGTTPWRRRARQALHRFLFKTLLGGLSEQRRDRLQLWLRRLLTRP